MRDASRKLNVELELGSESVRPAEPITLSMRDGYILRMIRGPEPGAIWSLYEGETIIGRGHQASVRIEDASLSPQHARIIVGAAGVTLRDLGSVNGTYVEGKRLDGPKVLRHGDRICMGSVYVRLDGLDPHERQVEQRMRETAIRDRLTGLYNRGVFDERLLAEVAFARRYGAAVGVIMIDIDHFKQVNDTYGHAMGDAVLRSIGQRLLNSARTEDVIARYGGEELSVIARGVEPVSLIGFADRIRCIVGEGGVMNRGQLVKVTVSCGVAGVTGASARQATPTSILQAADMALYEAKRQGRNRVIASNVS
jgi:two-component system, cell cycle response regulator